MFEAENDKQDTKGYKTRQHCFTLIRNSEITLKEKFT